MSLFLVELIAVLCAIAALAWAILRRQALASALESYFLEPSPPDNLACVRIALFGGLTWVATQTQAAWWAAQPAKLRVLLPGWRWLGTALPLDETTVTWAQYALIGASAMATLGLNTRISAPLAALLAVYVLGIPSFFGKVVHMDHALVLMVLVLAASACADAWSLDRWLQRRSSPPPGMSAAYTLPMRLCWLILGTIYFFPGVSKLWNNGDLWFNGQRLLFELNDEWSHHKGFVPPMRIDHYPWLLQLLGAGTLLFEIGFIFAVFGRRTRVLAAIAAFAFHTGVRLFLGITFYATLPLVMLLDRPWFRARDHADTARSLWPSAAVGGTLLLGQIYVGSAVIDTWPLAMHPRFSERYVLRAVTHDTRIRFEPRHGDEHDVAFVLRQHGVGADGFRRAMRRFDRDDPSQRGETGHSIVAMLRQNGLALDSGDELVIYDAAWNTFPLLERSNYRERVVRRYRVTEDDALERTHE